MTATLTSFSPIVITQGTQTSVGDFAKPWQPQAPNFGVDTLTGAATWDIPIEAPAGGADFRLIWSRPPGGRTAYDRSHNVFRFALGEPGTHSKRE